MDTKNFNEQPEILTVMEAAEILRIGRSTAYEAARTGQIPTVRIGRKILVPKAALARLLGKDAAADEC